MRLLDLPECKPLPAVKNFESEGWVVHAVTWKEEHGQALMSKGPVWAIGRWAPSVVELQESEQVARNVFDRNAPLGAPRTSLRN